MSSFNLHDEEDLIELLKRFQIEAHAIAVMKGFWRQLAVNSLDELIPTKLALVHSEVSEALEAHRAGGSKDEIGEELSDVFLRILDLAEAMKIDLGQTMINKHNKNIVRPYLHNKRY